MGLLCFTSRIAFFTSRHYFVNIKDQDGLWGVLGILVRALVKGLKAPTSSKDDSLVILPFAVLCSLHACHHSLPKLGWIGVYAKALESYAGVTQGNLIGRSLPGLATFKLFTHSFRLLGFVSAAAKLKVDSQRKLVSRGELI